MTVGFYCTSILLPNSCGIPFKPRASVRHGDTPATAIKLMGVGIDAIQGMAMTTLRSGGA